MNGLNAEKRGVAAFNKDVETGGGYAYSLGSKYSARVANRRITEAVHSLADFTGKRLIDVGCGDGTYTAEFADLAPSEVLGVDVAQSAVEQAVSRMSGDNRFRFETCSIYDLSAYRDRFDILVLRGVLHHLEDPAAAVAESVKVAPVVLVVEPNGLNPILKVLERVSRYHREHGEASYRPGRYRRWFASAGASITRQVHIGTVPMFCPEWFARACKAMEPLAEALPGVRHLGCGQHVFRAERG
jgi:SAM-dependent methyltransferase